MKELVKTWLITSPCPDLLWEARPCPVCCSSHSREELQPLTLCPERIWPKGSIVVSENVILSRAAPARRLKPDPKAWWVLLLWKMTLV